MGCKPKGEYPGDWKEIARKVKADAGWRCVRCKHPNCYDSGHVLTVHHFDGDKANCERWNLMALCQRCHLSVQARVDPVVALMFDPSPWAMPYIAGFYTTEEATVPESYDITRWIETYKAIEGEWPEWAEELAC